VIMKLLLLFVTSALAGTPVIVSRSEWGAASPTETNPLKINPPPFVVIHHSESQVCATTARCKTIVKNIQSYHMRSRGWEDIGYNFLVGGDGKVYEGRGWNKHGSHAIPYNNKSIGICFIGNFGASAPPSQQIQAAKDLIAYGVSKKLISSNYKVLGHRQAANTSCPGNSLFAIIKKWPRFLTN
ncbi:hypothetical protein AMK59_6527, partial [Oryctes borbonicus]